MCIYICICMVHDTLLSVHMLACPSYAHVPANLVAHSLGEDEQWDLALELEVVVPFLATNADGRPAPPCQAVPTLMMTLSVTLF